MVKQLLEQLVVYNPTESDAYKLRVGREGDGGYIVLAPYFERLECFYSYGISDDFSFDLDLATKTGAAGRLFDPNVSYPESLDAGLSFRALGVATGHGSIHDHVVSYGDTSRKMLLKMDVEGAEWEWLAQVPDTEVTLFEQICVELHFGDDPSLYGFYTKCLKQLNKHFYLFHVHANNFQPPRIYEEGILPPLLECSYISRKLCQCIPNGSVEFPVLGLDYSCVPNHIDTRLNFWPFITGQSSDIEKQATTQAAILAELRATLASSTEKNILLQRELSKLKSSASWRVTEPLRIIRSIAGF